MYGCESWTVKKADSQRIDAFKLSYWKKTLRSPLDSKVIKPVNPKGNQPWIFIGRTDAETEVPILWPPDVKIRFIRKDPNAGKDWRQEKGMTEDEMVGWHHWLNGDEFEQTPGDGDGQGSLWCCSPWGRSQTPLRDWTTNWICYNIASVSCFGLWPQGMWDLSFLTRIKPASPALEGEVLTTGWPGKSRSVRFCCSFV